MRHFSFACLCALVLVIGCRTYEGPFVPKTEEELDHMEIQNANASSFFHAGDYQSAEAAVAPLAVEQTVSQPLYNLERASTLLLQGRHDEAHELLMQTREHIELLFDEQSEEKAMSFWHGENNKVFKGDNHERATLYAFLALSFMEKQAWEDAIRCVKNGLLADASTEDDIYNSDYALLHYIGYVASRYAGDTTSAESYARELQTVLRARNLPVDSEGSSFAKLLEEAPLPNGFLVIWTGEPPSYFRGGAYDEIRHIVPGTNTYSMITLETASQGADTKAQQRILPSKLADLNYQATTRGGRAMDEVLANKAALKQGMETSRNILFVAGLACITMAGQNSDLALPMLCAGGACFIAGTIPWVIGECINATADVRYWHNLPGELIIAPITLPEEPIDLTLRAYTAWDNTTTRTITLQKGTSPFSVHHIAYPQATYHYAAEQATWSATPHRDRVKPYINALHEAARENIWRQNSWMETELPISEGNP